MENNKPRPHAELIKAWADGAEIEYYSQIREKWASVGTPAFSPSAKYRIKPTPKPDTVYYLRAVGNGNIWSLGGTERYSTDNLKLTFDGETGKLKSAEVLNVEPS